MAAVIGIDLGTCFSASAIVQNNNTEIIPNKMGNRITPSCVSISRNEILCGEEAEYTKDDPDFFYIEKSKIHIGEGMVYSTPQGEFSPEDIAYFILRHIINYSAEYLNTEISKAVITVPAYFNARQRRLTKDAAEKTNIEVLRIISEPTAASLLVSNNLKDGANILVYDLGGGTFDCSILSCHNSWSRVIATNGDTHLGGKNFDEEIAKYLCSQYDDLNSYQKSKLLSISESIKKQLSTRDTAVADLQSVHHSLNPKTVSFGEFKNVTSHLIDKTKQCIFNCLKDSNLEFEDINHVYMVGGSSRMRTVSDLLASLFVPKPILIGNPDESVAIGAAIHAHDLGVSSVPATLLVDAVPLSLGVKLDNGICKKIITRNSPIPTECEEIFTTAFDNQSKVVVDIYQGEFEFCKNNVYIGSLELINIEQSLKGTPKILVTFELDANAVLNVKAEDLKTKSVAESVFEFDHNIEQDNQINEQQDLLILKLKTEIEKLLIGNSSITNLEKEEITKSLELNNIEFMQSTLEMLKNDFQS